MTNMLKKRFQTTQKSFVGETEPGLRLFSRGGRTVPELRGASEANAGGLPRCVSQKWSHHAVSYGGWNMCENRICFTLALPSMTIGIID